MPKIFPPIIATVLLILAGWFIFHKSENQTIPTSDVVTPTKSAMKPKTNTYKSTQYGFSFEYPTDYTFSESSPEYLLIEKAGGKQYDWTYTVNVQNDSIQGPEKTTGQPFKEFITERLMIGCAADGPGGSIRCDKVTKSETFISTSGIEGLKVYLNQVSTHGKDVENKEIGPFYAFDISKQTGGKARAIVFSPANFDKLEETDITILSSIASSLTIK